MRRYFPPPSLLGNLVSGVRCALFLHSQPERFSTTPGDLTLIALVDVIANLASSLVLVGGDGTFNYAALSQFFFHIPLMLLCGYLAGKLHERPGLVTAIPVALIATSIPIEFTFGILEWLGAHVPRLRWLEDHLRAPNYYRFFWWWSAASLLFLVRLGSGTARRAGVIAAFLFFLVAPLWFYPRSDLWLSPAEDTESGELKVNEAVLTAQSRLLDDDLSQLLHGKRGEPNLYFIGFAGDAAQDVFLKEVTAGEKLFAEHFAGAGRTLLLANNPQSATTIPFATATNLGRALNGIGKVMDRDQDVLFLYLTSHGSRQHELDVSNGPLDLDQITPESIRRMLKSSEIPYRVIVVSACYSGGFIEPLKDDRTLIITAADPTHESFGCGFGEKYTWFGDAFFGALSQNYSITKAFDQARETIRKWENEQGETPSNPQIWIGKKIEKKLAPIQHRLENQAQQ
ncbi:C13 family peptidase [Geomesophilobacter sediminis]|uniref:Peptidase n=1 Tax=Geomesophilobacter sediminis TaxID=2798584 RepID=A0A8J7S6R9_9BACT|nr:C13 family peptidase [Geomesophilobacter sediminis]MBJ6726581.1 peptidase [Geomesophilobacter sediminis]